MPSVNISTFGGVGAQFFNNNGIPLSGGKIYSYQSGTTTPANTYTSSFGNTAHTNPIVLDSAGRVPSGEIWLVDGVNYKFLLKDANNVLIATYDNISGINSNFIAYTNSQEIQTATAGQTVFTLTTMQYLTNTNSLSVFVDGVNQYGPGALYSYVETDSTTVTFTDGLHVGAEVKFTTTQQQSAGIGNATQITYDPPFTGAVAETVAAKLAQTVSVKDFGAVGDGTTDDTAAIQAAIDSLSNGGEVRFPAGSYLISSTINITSSQTGITLRGTNGAAIWDGATSVYEAGSVIIKKSTMTTEGIKSCGLRLCITDLAMSGETGNTGDGIYLEDGQNTVLTNVSIAKVGGNGIRIGSKGSSGNVNGWMLNSVTTMYCGDNGVYIYDQYDIANPNANGGTATGLVTLGNISHGLDIANGMYNTFNGLWSQQNGLYGVRIERVAGHIVPYYTNFIVSDIEANVSGNWLIDTTLPLHITYIGPSVSAPNINPDTTFSTVISGGAGYFRSVYFSTSQSALDYYKTATWTPADASGAGLTLTLVNCKYTRVGNLVTCCGQITYPTTTNTNQARFTLPFTANQGSFSISSNYATAIFGYTSGSDAYIYGAGQSTITNANLSGKELDVTISYLTT